MKQICFRPIAELSSVRPVMLLSEQAQFFSPECAEGWWEEDLESQSHTAAFPAPAHTAGLTRGAHRPHATTTVVAPVSLNPGP